MKGNYNKGRFIETKVVNQLDGSKIKDLDKDSRSLLRSIYGQLEDEEMVRCELVSGYKKPDFYIEYKGVRKYVSLKSGGSKTVHEEELDTFCDFLLSLGAKERDVQTLRFLFWGDGTFDGTGERYFSAASAADMFPELVKEFNKSINGDKRIVNEVIRRALFDGRKTDGITADYIYHFSEDYLQFAVAKQVMWNYVQSKDWDYRDTPHIGPLSFAPNSTNKNNAQYQFYRKRISFWWPHLSSDLKFINEHYVFWPKRKPSISQAYIRFGAPHKNRTRNLQIRSLTLYPVELEAHF